MGWQDAPIVKEGTPTVQPAWQSAPIAPAAPAAPAASHAPIEEDPVQDVVRMLKAVPHGVVKTLEGIGQNAYEHPLLGNIPALVDTLKRVAADPSGTLSSVGAALRNATPEQVGENVVAPTLLTGGVGEGATAVNGLRTAAAEAAAAPAAQLGLRTADGVGAKLAGGSAAPAVTMQNNRVAASVLGADAGVPHTAEVNAQTLAAAREAPGKLVTAGYSLVPPGALSDAARAQVAAARGPATITKPTPNVANQINDIESSLLDPNGQFTGEQLRATRNSLNSDANAGMSSDDADTRTIAKYKRSVVAALDQHLADSLPEGSPITPDMVQNARSTLAKNYQLQDLIGKGGDINLQKLAQLYRDNPDLLTGNTATVAQFAHEHPEVTSPISNTNRVNPPGVINDLKSVNIFRPVSSAVQALGGGLVGRRLLLGPRGEAIGQAMQAPVAGLGGEFEPQPLTQLSPPPGQAPGPTQQGLPLGPGMAPPVPNNVSVGEGRPGVPGTARGGATGLGQPLGDEFGLGVGEGKGPKKRR